MLSSLNGKQRKRLVQGLILSVSLLLVSDVLYRITFGHAAKLDPLVYDVKIAFIDDKIPIIPLFFFGYNLAFIFWFFAPFFIIQTGKKNVINFVILYLLTLIVCNLILYFLPTKLDRVAEGLFDPSHNSFGWKLLHICYNVDGGLIEYNLFPSTHCSNSIVFYLGLRNEIIPKKIQRAGLISTIIVIISTLLTKQHFFIDVAGGVIIPLVIYFVLNKVKKDLYENN